MRPLPGDHPHRPELLAAEGGGQPLALLPAEFKTYAEALAEHGYHVGFTGKGWAPGVAGRSTDGNATELAGTPFHEHKATPPAEHISDNDYAANFEAFLDARPEGTRAASGTAASSRTAPTSTARGAGAEGRQPADIDRVPRFWPDNETVRNDMLDYAFEIEHFDRHLAAHARPARSSAASSSTP